MMKILLAAFVLLLIPASAAYGQVVETKGQNYDLVENFFTGEAIWNSTPERIMDGGWQNYALSNTAEKVIFNTNAVGSFVFDKDSCSYSIYENGFASPETQIIPSVSAVATYLNNGQWQNLPINDEACTVTVDRYNDGVFLTSTKVITEDITEDIFIPISAELFYGNSTFSNFTLITNSTGGTGYFNGETITTTGAVVEEFTQELRLDIYSGFKETFKVTHDGNQELGISQTIHSGGSITIGETVINIAELNGQSFDRQYIVDNEAEILAITDSVSYDFDTGIKSLTNVNIIFDGDYKVNLDYANGLDGVPFVGYLEIDPTFTSTTSNDVTLAATQNTGCVNPSSGTFQNSATEMTLAYMYPNVSPYDKCYRGYIEYDISSFPSGATITDTKIDAIIQYGMKSGDTMDVTSMSTQGSTLGSSWSTGWTAISTGVTLLDDDTQLVGLSTGVNVCVSPADPSTCAYSWDLGTNADSELTSLVASGQTWFSLGFNMDETNQPTSGNWGHGARFAPASSLVVTYTLPTVPQPPTNLSTVTGIPIELDWDATPTSGNGGSAITGYKVYRTLNEFAQVELPDSSGSDSQITFTDNEFLLHGFEAVSSSSGYDMNTQRTSGYGQATSYSGVEPTGYVGYNTGGTWHYRTAFFFDVSAVPTGSTITDATLRYDVTGGNGASNCSIQVLSVGSSDSGSAIYDGVIAGTEVVNSNWCEVSSGNDYTVSLGNLGTVSGSELALGFSSDPLPTSYKYIVMADAELDITYESVGFEDKSTNSISITATGTTTDGTIGTGIQNPDLSYTDSNLPDGTDDFSIGSWVKLDSSPTNTKLLGLNDVTFNVGTTTASVDEYSTTSVTWDSSTASGFTINGDELTKSASAGWGNSYAKSTQTLNPSTGGGEIIFTKQSDSGATGTILGLNTGTFPLTNGFYGDYMMYYDNIFENNSYKVSFTGHSNTDVMKIKMDSNGLVTYYVNDVLVYTSTQTASGDYYAYAEVYAQNKKIYSASTLTTNNIISATGLTDNTVTPQHYSFVRDGNDWEIYQNGVSEATATDSTSLGTNVGNNYSTNLDGMVDEYFINSDVLTSTEIDTIYERGVAPTLLTTVTATEHDDGTVVGGNSYFYSLKSTNIIGDSDFLTPFVSGLAGTPPNAPVISTAINNPNTTPLEVTVSISPDAVVGSGTLTGFEIYRDGVLVDTVGLVSSVPNTVPSGGGTFEFSSKSISTHGTSALSNLSSITTPSVPDAPSLTLSINNPNPNPLDITATFIAPSNSGGSAVTSYNLLHSTDDVTYTPVATNVTPDSTYTVSAAGLHYFKSQANNLIGSSLESAAVSINTPSVPDAPVTVSTSIGNPNANPLDIVVGFSASPDDQGSAITGYKVYRSIDDVTYTEITTLGNSVYSYADTVTVSGGYYYKVSSLNNVGEGLQSAYSLINTPTVPDAPVLTSGAVNSSQIDSTWTTPSNGNSEIISYEISVDGTVSNVGLVNADSQTGLTQNTAYEIKIRAVNNVGTSAWSNAITSTTNTPPSGTNTISLNNSWGDVVIVDNTITVTGNPTPTLDKIEFILDTDIVSTVNNPSLTGTYAITLPDTVQHGLLVRVTASNGDTVYYDSNSITITGTTVYRVDAAEGGNTVAYTTARTPHPTNDALDQIELKWAKDTFPFDGSCTFMSPSQALEVRDLNNLPSSLSFTDQNGVNIYDTTVNISEKNNAYVYCWSGDDLQFGAQSEALGSNALLAGLSGLDSGLGTTTVDPVTGAETSYSILGAPMIVIFVLLIAGQATGRTAPTFIIIILAAVGILMGLGFFIIDEGIFGLILIMGAMGVMIGKKFL